MSLSAQRLSRAPHGAYGPIRALGLSTMTAGALLFALAAPRPSQAAETKDYAYILLQGKVTDPIGKRPLAGATVRLTAGTQAFEATTDDKGLFVFQRLPVATYAMAITTADGKSIRAMEKSPGDDRDAARLKVKLGRGASQRAVIEARDGRVRVVVPEQPVKWSRFWKQFAIFLGAAGALAL